MSNYNPEIKVYYGKINADNMLIPAPDISINLEYNYGNDTIIGYTYIVTLTGYITALDLRNIPPNGIIPEQLPYGIGAVVDHINKVRNILTGNGGILHVIKSSDNTHILKAKGGILRSFDVNESSNNWTHYATYTASIEFNTIDFTDHVENCENIFLDPSTYTKDDPGIIDINRFKIKSFQDGWSFNFDENESFNNIKLNDKDLNLNINNRSFIIEYTIAATGKHFFHYTDENNITYTLLPAFEQAKNFVQYRLYYQVTNLLNNVLKNSYKTACENPKDLLSDINIPGESAEGLLKNIGDANYKIFNEEISCESSESDGTFSVTYRAVAMSTLGNPNWSSLGAKHTLSKNINRSFNGGAMNTSITVNGTIEGYLEGGLIKMPGPIRLPNKGSFIVYNDNNNNKYNNAKLLLDKIYNKNNYGAGMGLSGKQDLNPAFKLVLGITPLELGSAPGIDDPVPDPPHPTSFNLTHDYNNGIITYSVEYNSSKACGRKYEEISVQISNPTKVIAVFNIPNSNSCSVIQELGTRTAKTVSITIRGFDYSFIGRPDIIDLNNELSLANPGCYSAGYLPSIAGVLSNGILTKKEYTKNPVDGSYSLVMNYVCSIGC